VPDELINRRGRALGFLSDQKKETLKPQQTQNAAENDCEKQAAHSFFQRRSGSAAAPAFLLIGAGIEPSEVPPGTNNSDVR
jgi:hypothetical protein